MLGKVTHLQRSTEMLYGHLKGIAFDDDLNDTEIAKLQGWLESHGSLSSQWPFSEIKERLDAILSDGIIEQHEREELCEWCQDLARPDHPGYDIVDQSIRLLHGALQGMQSDGKVTPNEAYGLYDWLQDYISLKGVWPFSDVWTLIEHILEDDHVSKEEEELLFTFCEQFSERIAHDHVPKDKLDKSCLKTEAPYLQPIEYICNANAVVTFEGKSFCFTGSAESAKRCELHAQVEERGGSCASSVSKKIDYLVIGAASSPNWMFSTYGRKIEAAKDLQEMGYPVEIIHEHHYISAVAAIPTG